MRLFHAGVSRIAPTLCAAVAAATLAAPTQAQLGEAAGFQEAMVPDFFKRDVQLFINGLGLDESQRVILEMLLVDYQDDFDSGTQGMIDKFQEMISELQGGDQRRVMQIVFEPLREWHHDKLALRDQFLITVQSVLLNEEQMTMWPKFERELRRDKSLPKGELSAEDLNLFLVLKEIDVDAGVRAQIQPIIDEYDLALDAALRQRDQLAVASFNSMTEAIQTEDADVAMRVISQQISARADIRAVNLQYIYEIGTALPADIASEFNSRALARAFPRIYRATPTERMFTAAKELEDLGDGVLEQIIALENDFLIELATKNADLAEKTQRSETDKARERAENFARKVRGEAQVGIADNMRAEFQERDELGSRYTRQLKLLLTDEQFASLPGAQRWLRRGQDAQERARAVRDASRRKQEMLDRMEKGERPGAGQVIDPGRGLGTNDGGGDNGKGGIDN